MKSKIVLAIDPSTKTGFTVLEVNKTNIHIKHLEEYKAPSKGMERLGFIAGRLDQLLSKYAPDIVYIEGYSFMSKFNLVTMAEVGTIFRYFLWQAGYEVIEVAPTTLKKFITGKGNSNKNLILLNVFKNWNINIENDNIADSFGLAMFAAYRLLGISDEKGVWKKSDAKNIRILECD